MGRSDTPVVREDFSLSSLSSNKMGLSDGPFSPIFKSLTDVGEEGVSILGQNTASTSTWENSQENLMFSKSDSS